MLPSAKSNLTFKHISNRDIGVILQDGSPNPWDWPFKVILGYDNPVSQKFNISFKLVLKIVFKMLVSAAHILKLYLSDHGEKIKCGILP